MTNGASDGKKDVICCCSGTTVAQIKRYVDRGIDDLERISQASGACSGCGGCEADILELLAEYKSRTEAATR
ncbi:MAG: (2Fe-2S)-binding protein [Methylococcaceae bacterium]|nr:(2Fe-2S)-binding protein [Methylococcaceae bacterium]